MSISSEITRISGNVADALVAIANKGVTIPAGSTSDDLADLIAQIQQGGGGGSITVIETPDSHGGTIVEITGEEIPDGDNLEYGGGAIVGTAIVGTATAQ